MFQFQCKPRNAKRESPRRRRTELTRDIIETHSKVRGREYLRIIYGPEYTLPQNLDRLKRRGLGEAFAGAARIRIGH